MISDDNQWLGRNSLFADAPMRIIALFLLLLLSGCAANPQKVQQVAGEEADRLPPPVKALSTFARFELQPLIFADEIAEDKDKFEEAQELEQNLRAKISPLLDEWNESGGGGQGTLLIEPALLKLRIVGGGTRFFGGVFTGGSFIDMDIVLIDSDSGTSIGSARISRNAGALAGAWSIGKSDQNLDDYIVSIVYEYLSDNY